MVWRVRPCVIHEQRHVIVGGLRSGNSISRLKSRKNEGRYSKSERRQTLKVGTAKADTRKSEPVHTRILMGVIVPVRISRVDRQPFEC